MTPIAGLTEVKRLPRVGKIHLGVKKISPRTGNEYPFATPYFVVPLEVEKVYGPKPTRLEVIIPIEDDELWCPQYYRQYSNVRGLVCKGDGVTCRRMIDADKPENIANRETKTVKWEEGLPCPGWECPDYQEGACQESMNLQFFLPRVNGLGIWQIDTGSINSIRHINDSATAVRAACGRISWIPLTLTLGPEEVVNPDDGKKKTVYCMSLKHESSLLALIEASEKPRKDVLITMPTDEEAPMDRRLTIGNKDNAEEFEGAVEGDIDNLWGEAPEPQNTNRDGPRDWAWVKKTLPLVNRTEDDVKTWFKNAGLVFSPQMQAESVFNTSEQKYKDAFIEKLAGMAAEEKEL